MDMSVPVLARVLVRVLARAGTTAGAADLNGAVLLEQALEEELLG